jgi:hypothetical protein
LAAGAKKQGLVLHGLQEGPGELVGTGKSSSRMGGRGSGKAAGAVTVLDSGTVLPGEVRGRCTLRPPIIVAVLMHSNGGVT